MLSFNFNVSFSRADENHATTYRSGVCITAESLERAWLKLGYRQHERADLRYTAVELHAILGVDGDVQYYRPLTRAEVSMVTALRAGAVEAGNLKQVADCDLALTGDAEAKGRVSWELQFAAIEAEAKAAEVHGQVSDELLTALRSEAGEVGDLEQVTLCDKALAGDAAAVTECARVIADARAQDDSVCEHGYAQGCRACDPDGRG